MGKDYYASLGVSKTATDEELRKAYKQQALKFHPDKNPDNKDAAEKKFKEISEAFECLRDPEKRKLYDQHGTCEPNEIHQRHYHYQPGSRVYQEEVTPEDLFNMFFGGPPGGVRFRRYNAYRPQPMHREEDGRAGPPPQQNQGTNILNLAQLLPLVLLLLFSLFSQPSNPENPVSLTKTGSYILERRTQTHGVVYYVKDDFASAFGKDPHTLRVIEELVEDAYIKDRRQQCYVQKQTQRRMMHDAKAYYKGVESEERQKLAMQHPAPACEELTERFRINVAS